MNYDKLQETAEELYDYARLEGSELGELWSFLCELGDHSAIGYASEEFQKAFVREIEQQLRTAKSEFKIVEREETTTRKTKYLEENGN